MTGCIGCHPNNVIVGIQHGPAGILLAIDGGVVQGTVLIHRNAAVIEKVAVIDLVNGAVIQQELEMTLHPYAVAEGKGQIVHHGFLLRRETIGVFR